MNYDVGTVILIVLALIIFLVFFHLFFSLFVGRCIYRATLRRANKNEWGRVPVNRIDLQVKMFEIGCKWHEENIKNMHEVHIVNDGLNLYGEYYDFGNDSCVIILSGRMESLTYGYYFARPYFDSGMNVLVIDPRAHGESDGEFNTIGFEESKDILVWSEFLHEKYKINSIVYHAICIGAAGGMFALTSENCPEYVKGIVAEGMFPNFCESMKNHLIERKKMIFPIIHCIDFWMKKYTKHSMKFGPIDVIGKYKKPLLMLHSKEDKYSKPFYAQILFDMCPSAEKEIVWFPEGRHSFLRITDTEKYDNAIKTFLSENISVAERK